VTKIKTLLHRQAFGSGGLGQFLQFRRDPLGLRGQAWYGRDHFEA
jgi:hypothetical protein